ncbi:MAG: hypothetical protein JST92_22705, partial [Deltaproteobacteria bacterium]|nr:hypothetical protein [Deltaproteobacteria bacterium]
MRHSLRLVAAAAALAWAIALPASAQTEAAAPAAGAAADAAKKPARKSSKTKPAADAAKPAAAAAAPSASAAAAPAAGTAAPAKAKKGRKGKKGAPAPAPEAAAQTPPPAPPPPQTVQTVTIKQAPPPPPPPKPAEPEYTGPPDDDPPSISHTAITKALKGRPLTVTAKIIDPAGVFQPALFLRKRGTGDYIPIRMNASKTVAGEYWVEIDAKLISVDLEYYIECYDNAGNGPARAGSPEQPFFIKLEEEKKAPPPPPVAQRPKGAPPAISHSAIGTAVKGKPVEISAKLVGETGVSRAKVMFRKAGEKDYRELPM